MIALDDDELAAMHIDARKRLYEKLHPETKKGAAANAERKAKATGEPKSQDETLAFIDDTAKKTGKSRATNSPRMHVDARKTLYEKIYGNTVSVRIRGGPGRGKKKNESQDETGLSDTDDAEAFVDDTAKRTNKPNDRAQR